MASFRSIPVLFLAISTLPAQTFSLGVKGGVPATDDLDSYFATSESKRYTVGPMATIGLPGGWSFEVDALYRRVGYRSSDFPLPGIGTDSRLRGHSWEFPMLLRKSLFAGLYAGAGYAPRAISGSGYVISYDTFGGTTTTQRFDLPGRWDTTHGIVASAGWELHRGHIRIAPEARYTYWTGSALHEQGSHGYSLYSNQHQLEILVGVSWGSR